MSSLIYDSSANYASYFAPLKPRIRFKSLDGLTTHFTFDGFAGGTNPLNCIYMDVERAIGETGVFNIIVEDSHNVIDRSKLENMKVYIELGKSPASYKQFFIGFADIFTIRRPRTNYMEYLLTGPSTRIQAAELKISRRQASKIQDISNPKVVPDAAYNINNIFKNSLTKSSWRPLNQDAIDSGHPQTSWEDDLISSEVNINYPVINEDRTTVWDFWDKLCSTAGAVWDINYDTLDKEIVMLSFNPALHTGITIKSGDLKAPSTDQASKTAYILSNFDVEDNATKDAGTATRLYSLTSIDRQTVASSFEDHGRTTLDFKAIAQQVIIQNDERRITDFAFVLERIGEPASPQDRVNGDFVLDSGDNKPTGKVIGTFKIPLSDLKRATQTVFVNDVDVKVRFLEGSNKAWLRLFQRSGNENTVPAGGHLGDPMHDPDNTVAWHHNNKFNQTQALYSAQAVEGDYDKKDSLVWTTTNQGPIYTFSILSNIRRLQARTNWQAANRLRMKEADVDSSFLTDPQQVSSFLSINLARTSKARRSVIDVQVKLPNNFLFAPYQWVSFNDGLSQISQDLQVQRVRYVISALPGDPQIGALYCDLTLGGLYNSLIGNCSCDM
jgi:hypothetical protein